MKKLSLSFLLVLAFVLCNAQPKIQFDSNTYDFGKVKEEGGKVTGRFEFTNVGTEDLILTNVRPGCGCTAADYSKDPVAPGQKGYIQATYNPYNRPGAFNKSIRVTTNEPQFSDGSNASPHMIFIKGEVLKRPATEFEKAGYTKTSGMVRFLDPNVTHNILNTDVILDTFKVRNFWTKPVTLQLESRLECVTEAYRSFGNELQPKQEGIIVLRYDAGKRNAFGQQKDMVTYVTNDSIEAKKPIHYAVNIKEDFSAWTKKQMKKAPVAVYSATECDFAEVAKNTQKEKEITLTNNGKNPLVIRNIVSSNGIFKASASITNIPAGETANIKINMKANSRAGVQKASLEVITNDPNNPVQVINLKALIK
ncbi:MAG: DUF1573 domain-containing protein [Bacteroidales bacterium]|nr:DUF1573 domain-containing protein [Bacteroidales bacterium]